MKVRNVLFRIWLSFSDRLGATKALADTGSTLSPDMDLDLLVLPGWACIVHQDILRNGKIRRNSPFPQDERPGGHIILPQGASESA